MLLVHKGMSLVSLWLLLSLGIPALAAPHNLTQTSQSTLPSSWSTLPSSQSPLLSSRSTLLSSRSTSLSSQSTLLSSRSTSLSRSTLLPSQSVPLPSRSAPLPSQSAKPPPNTLLCAEGVDCDTSNICELDMKRNNADQIKEIWEASGAQPWFKNWLTANGGAKDWANNILGATISQGYDCVTFPEGDCGPPASCDVYEPAEAAYIHTSMASLYSQFSAIREYLQDLGIKNLANGIKEVVDVFGPPPPEDNYIFQLLIGAFVGAAALAGPIWKIASPMTGVVGALNLAGGLETASNKPRTPLEYNDQLERGLGEFYEQYIGSLDESVTALFRGDAEKFSIGDQNPVDWVVNTFDQGKMLNPQLVRPDVDKWFEAFETMVKQGFVVKSLNMSEYYISQRFDMEESECAEGKYSYWMNERCTRIVKDHPERSMVSRGTRILEDDKYKAFTETYKFNYEEALKNAIDCSKKPLEEQKKAPELLGFPVFGDTSMPPCFFNLPVREVNYAGISKEIVDKHPGVYPDT